MKCLIITRHQPLSVLPQVQPGVQDQPQIVHKSVFSRNYWPERSIQLLDHLATIPAVILQKEKVAVPKPSHEIETVNWLIDKAEIGK